MSYAKTQYIERQKKLAKTEKAMTTVVARLKAAEAVANKELQEKVKPHREAVEKLQQAHQQSFGQKHAADIGKIKQLESRHERLQAQMVKFADAELAGAELDENDASLKDVPSDEQLDAEIDKLAEEAPDPTPAPALKSVDTAKPVKS